MKYVLILLYASLCIYAMDEAQVDKDIATIKSVEVLSLKLQQAPAEYHDRYVEAIKNLVAKENEAKRVEMMDSITGRDSGRNSGKSGGNGGGGGGGGGR